jgi:CubicO group peptidase (beta-lactamase class C family)
MTALVLLLIAAAATAAESSPAPEPPSLRWDSLKPGLPPREGLFAGEYPAGMLRRPDGLTLDTWFHDGWMRIYALLHLDSVVRCAEIDRGTGPVWMFGSARQPDLLERTQVTIPDETFPHRDVPLPARRVFEIGNGQGILVVRHGKIVFEDYPGMDPGQRHHWMSISKSAVNMLMGRLVMEGKLDLTRKVEDYLPELAGKGYGSFTVQELADMDADVDMNESDYTSPTSPFWNWGRASGWFADDGRWPGGVKQLLLTIERRPRPTGEAAQKVRYTGSNTQTLAWIIERQSGRPMQQYFEESIWRHIGAVADAAVSVDRHGVPFAGGGLSSTLRDLARYGTIWATGGLAPDGTRVFDAAWLEENTSGKGLLVMRDYRYHNHSYSKNGAIVHQGHSGQMLWVHPGHGTIVACFGSNTEPTGQKRWSSRALLFMAEAIDRELAANDRAPATPTAPAAADR